MVNGTRGRLAIATRRAPLCTSRCGPTWVKLREAALSGERARWRCVTLMRMRLSSCWVVVLILGCSSNGERLKAGDAGGGGAAGAAGAGTGGGSCAATLDGVTGPSFEQPSSRIRVRAGSYFTVLDGAVVDGPSRELHAEAARDGSCRLLTYDSGSFCDPACENPAICINGVCERFPEPLSAGPLTARFGSNEPVVVEPIELGRYFFQTEDFGYDDVRAVAVSAPGDEAAGFDLEACLASAPQAIGDWDQLLQKRVAGGDVALAWSNPVPTARIYLRMTTCIGTHGGISPVEVECEGPDVGKLTLPGAYLDALYEQGWGRGECGVNDVLRYHASQSGSGDGAVQLRVESVASFFFQPRLGTP